jgi:hypothetical protein
MIAMNLQRSTSRVVLSILGSTAIVTGSWVIGCAPTGGGPAAPAPNRADFAAKENALIKSGPEGKSAGPISIKQRVFSKEAPSSSP